MNKTTTVIVTAVITALIIGGGIYWYTTSLSPTSDESVSEVETNETATPIETISETTYQNDKYGFSFSYDPKKYSVAESRSRSGATGDESDLIRMTAIGESCPAVDIFISTATLEQELNDLEFRISGDTVQTTVDGISATKRSGNITENLPPCGSEKTEVVFESKGNVFVITAFKNWKSSLDELLESIDF
ncbi:MAG TPA: hypothetical protein PLK76_04015 [bacterium]|nr:hypothetical protein [bacterium]